MIKNEKNLNACKVFEEIPEREGGRGSLGERDLRKLEKRKRNPRERII